MFLDLAKILKNETWQWRDKGGEDCQVSETNFSFVFQEDKLNHAQEITGPSKTSGK